ncbi:MAG: hypothetical protein K6T51_01085 [Rubrobacteraceae bacterium]|nr:hypothetical protein [Rubrobacteraceae bacterium]
MEKTFQSILFEDRRAGELRAAEPTFFSDLRLDAVVEELLSGREEYDLAPFFHTPLREPGEVTYRQEVARDLERGEVREVVEDFARRMRAMRECLSLAGKLHHELQKQRWFLDAAGVYCEAVRSLARELPQREPASRGLRALSDYLAGYAGSEEFSGLEEEVRALREDLAGVVYTVHIRGNRVRVDTYEDEEDYGDEIERVFARFARGAAKDHRVRFRDPPELGHVEERILELVARLNPDVFGRLDEFCRRRRDYLDETVAAFDREVQFYLAYLEYAGRFREAGLPFCYPEVSEEVGETRVEEGFDLALAASLLREGGSVVKNGFHLRHPERILVVTGPNQGGKTTFARMVGQLHYLASLGLPVPAAEAHLHIPDAIFTHFEREEGVERLRSKLEDDLVRLHEILREATGESLIVLNESFSSTTLEDAARIGTDLLGRIERLGALCVCVTFIDELATLGEETVSMVGTVDPEDPSVRTFRIVRKPPEGLAYALALARKYGLTYEDLKRRVKR